MDELRMLACLRDEVGEAEPDQVARILVRLDAARATRVPAARPRVTLRLGVAAGLAATIALGGGVVLTHDWTSHASVQSSPRGTPEMTLAAAVKSSIGTSYTFHATATLSTSDHAPRHSDARGAWDPNGPQCTASWVNDGRPAGELRLIGGVEWYRIPGEPWRRGDAGSFVLGIPVAPGLVMQWPVDPRADASDRAAASPDVEPVTMLKRLLDNGAQITDRGVSGSGAAAVHTWGFRAQLPPVNGAPSVGYLEGAVVVGVASGKITELTVRDVGPQAMTRSITVTFSNFGIPVRVTAP
jgi:hypothetical protein